MRALANTFVRKDPGIGLWTVADRRGSRLRDRRVTYTAAPPYVALRRRRCGSTGADRLQLLSLARVTLVTGLWLRRRTNLRIRCSRTLLDPAQAAAESAERPLRPLLHHGVWLTSWLRLRHILLEELRSSHRQGPGTSRMCRRRESASARRPSSRRAPPPCPDSPGDRRRSRR